MEAESFQACFLRSGNFRSNFSCSHFLQETSNFFPDFCPKDLKYRDFHFYWLDPFYRLGMKSGFFLRKWEQKKYLQNLFKERAFNSDQALHVEQQLSTQSCVWHLFLFLQFFLHLLAFQTSLHGIQHVHLPSSSHLTDVSMYPLVGLGSFPPTQKPSNPLWMHGIL